MLIKTTPYPNPTQLTLRRNGQTVAVVSEPSQGPQGACHTFAFTSQQRFAIVSPLRRTPETRYSLFLTPPLFLTPSVFMMLVLN